MSDGVRKVSDGIMSMLEDVNNMLIVIERCQMVTKIYQQLPGRCHINVRWYTEGVQKVSDCYRKLS